MAQDTYLVIGGSGFLGRHIVEMLVARGDAVSVFDIVQRHHDVPFYSGDISDQSQVEDALHKSAATCIIHTASPPHGLDAAVYWKVNVEGTKAVIAAATTTGVRKLVYTSSAGVVFYGEALVDVDERLPYPEKPFDAYNESKAKAEQLVLEANDMIGLLTVALRPAGIFGPGDRQVMDGLAQVVANKQTHYQMGDNNNLFDFTYVTNVARAHLLAADRLSPKKFTRDEVLAKPISLVSLSTGSKRVPTSKARPIGPVMERPADAQELEEAFEKASDVDERSAPLTRFDQFSESALDIAESEPLCIAGQAFFITNGEPVYFWDFSRFIWRELGAPDGKITKMPQTVGLLFASILEWWGWLTGHEPVLTRFRVTFGCISRWHNIDKARRVLGYEPEVSLLEGVRRTVEWYKKEHMGG